MEMESTRKQWSDRPAARWLWLSFLKPSKAQSLKPPQITWNPHISKLKQHATFKLESMRWEHLPGDTQPADRKCWHILCLSFSSQICYEPLGTYSGAHASQGTPPLCCHVNWHRSDHRQAVWHDSLPATLGALGRFLSNLSNLTPSFHILIRELMAFISKVLYPSHLYLTYIEQDLGGRPQRSENRNFHAPFNPLFWWLTTAGFIISIFCFHSSSHLFILWPFKTPFWKMTVKHWFFLFNFQYKDRNIGSWRDGYSR